MSSTFVLVLNMVALGIYSNAVYFMITNRELAQATRKLSNPGLSEFGHLRFLTFQCLIVQLISSFLHVGAHFVSALKKPRDSIFSGLAYPMGSTVVYSFWAVWHLAGRELIFPSALSEFFPDWLNHSVHTIMVPINFLNLFLVYHKPSRIDLMLIISHAVGYIIFLHYIRAKTGYYVYKYLDVMGVPELIVYFAFTVISAWLVFKSGQMLTNFVHKPPTQRPSLKKSKKAK